MSAALRVAQAVRRDSQEEDGLLDLTAGICAPGQFLEAGRDGLKHETAGGGLAASPRE